MNWTDNKPYFRHFVIELEYPFEETDSLGWTKEKVELVLKKLNIQKIKSIEHLFRPQGASLVYIISSSHMAVHTWPENNYIHIELLTCSRNKKLGDLDSVIKDTFPGVTYKITELTY